MELEGKPRSAGRGLTMQLNKVHHVWTVDYVAKDLGVEADLIHDLTLHLEPEDGVIWVYDVGGGDGVLAFTDEGIEEVRALLREHKQVTGSKL